MFGRMRHFKRNVNCRGIIVGILIFSQLLIISVTDLYIVTESQYIRFGND